MCFSENVFRVLQKESKYLNLFTNIYGESDLVDKFSEEWDLVFWQFLLNGAVM